MKHSVMSDCEDFNFQYLPVTSDFQNLISLEIMKWIISDL